MKKVAAGKLSFILAFLYVGLGTLYFYWFMVGDFIFVHYQPVFSFLDSFFRPVISFPILIMLVEADPFWLLLICQVLSLCIIWVLLFGIISLYRKIMKRFRSRKAA